MSQRAPQGVPPMAIDITDAELQQLISEGLSQTKIARRTGMPRSTLRRRIERLSTPQATTDTSEEGTPKVYAGIQTAVEFAESWDEFQEMLAWWRERKRALPTEADTEQRDRTQNLPRAEAVHRSNPTRIRSRTRKHHGNCEPRFRVLLQPSARLTSTNPPTEKEPT